ncbi:hypothetical protein GCM10007377_09760 [Galliscardovia ingluviei]|uniref:Uncharacterized protein n=1 Tax=Galliscardovia ingluviei TaxID=1769422 RepID=A0A8J3AGY5_9BIFI|nr:hypothetical protein GCM10007377_09760 [Galliscardovia ingluviei]
MCIRNIPKEYLDKFVTNELNTPNFTTRYKTKKMHTATSGKVKNEYQIGPSTPRLNRKF